jgi:hypothetical protein
VQFEGFVVMMFAFGMAVHVETCHATVPICGSGRGMERDLALTPRGCGNRSSTAAPDRCHVYTAISRAKHTGSAPTCNLLSGLGEPGVESACR